MAVGVLCRSACTVGYIVKACYSHSPCQEYFSRMFSAKDVKERQFRPDAPTERKALQNKTGLNEFHASVCGLDGLR